MIRATTRAEDLDRKLPRSEARAAMVAWLRGDGDESVKTRAQGIGTPTAGGNLAVGEFLSEQIFHAAGDVAPMIGVSTVVTTGVGTARAVVGIVDEVTPGVVQAEHAPAAESNDFITTRVELGYKVFDSDAIVASRELVQDSPVFIDSIGQLLGRRLGRVANSTFTIAATTAAGDSGIAAAALTPTVGELGSLADSLDWEYLNRQWDPTEHPYPTSCWMMHPQTWRALVTANPGSRALMDRSAGVLRFGEAFGIPVVQNKSMPSAASTRGVLLGDFRSFHIRSGEMHVYRLAERYATQYQVGFRAIWRADGGLGSSSAVKFLSLGT